MVKLEVIKKMNKEKFNSVSNLFSIIPLLIPVIGIFIIGFFVAPIIFKNVTPRPFASDIMIMVFNRFYPVAFVCSMITLGVEFVRIVMLKKAFFNSKYLMIQTALIFSVIFLTAYSDLKILPRINEMRAEQTGPTLWTNEEFTNLHKRSELFAKITFCIGLIPIGMMVFRRNNNLQS